MNRARPDAVFLANPNNPTGTLIPKRQIARAVAFCEQNRIDLVLDESFIELTRGTSMVARAARFRHLMVIRSLTKSYALAGLRIGYLVARRSVIEGLTDSIEPWSVNTLALSAAAACISDAKYLQKSLSLIQREREYLFRGVAKLGWLHPYPSKANFLLARIQEPRFNSASLKRKLETANILIRDTYDFRGLGAKYVRLAVRRPDENRRLLTELARIGQSVMVRRKKKR